ncbi:toll/interleukin-1 receptor domain-containing protein [Streptomyces sp. NPDC049627]|uniref:toll/interleukin-1 receptor domain-containing protein n=1 Tax=Streptomyces sp. NPDC049627 TaxID=3365595 RepID=UPI003796627E
MGGIFINYRRGDHEDVVRELYDRLEHHFGEDQVFRDVVSIVPGQRYPDTLRERVADCEVLLVVVHRGWADARGEAGERRLDDGTDWVRREIDQALHTGRTVIPLLLDGATPPRPDHLPEPIRDLAHRNAQFLRTARFDADLAELTAVLETEVSRTWRPVPPPQPGYRPGRRPAAVTALLCCALLLTVPALPIDQGWYRRGDLPWTLYGALACCLVLCAALVGVAMVRFPLRRSVDRWERELHTVKHRTYIRQTWPVIAGLVVFALFCAVSAWGDGGAFAALVLLLVLGLAGGRTAAAHVRITRREADLWARWPQTLPTPVTRVELRRAIARLDLRLAGARAPLSREQREKARWELDDLRAAVRRVGDEAGRSRSAWLREDHPWLLGGYAVGLTLIGALALASGAAFDAVGDGRPRVHLTLTAIVLIGVGLALATLELGHRRQRMLRAELVTEATERIAALADRVTALSAPARTKRSTPAPRPEEFAEPD